ncbi:MAG: hypothetical protein EPN41_10055 [Candidimonas sp.]|nr:MAG: hypothetical protein EPN41_10055 [Candidimonas sp.]
MAGQSTPHRFPVMKVRGALAVLLLLSLALIGQRGSVDLFKGGVLLVIITVLLGFTFNNIRENSNTRQVIVALLITWLITAAVVAISIVIAPLLTTLGR